MNHQPSHPWRSHQLPFPRRVAASFNNGKEITLRHLATHTAGLPRMPDNLQPADEENPAADYTVKQLYTCLSRCALESEPGEKYKYSNLGVGLLGHILELKAGTNYEAIIRSIICDPLGMASTRIELDKDLKSRLAPGHDNMGRPIKNWDLPTLAGAGALRSTANDLLKFLAANMITNAQGPLYATLQKVHLAQHAAGSGQVGLGWHLKQTNSNIIWHNGGTGGYHSFVGFDKSQQLGVVVLVNSPTSIDDIGLHLLGAKSRPEWKPSPKLRLADIDPKIYSKYVGR